MKIIFLIFVAGVITGLCLQYIWDNHIREDDWLDCIELPECPIDSAMPREKLVRT